MAPGKIIFLNGTSSAGKTSIARALQQLLDEPYLYVALDTFFDMVPTRYVVGEEPWTITETVANMIAGFHRAIAALAEAGNNVIVDHVLQEPPWLRECAELLSDFNVVFVGVHCALAELERREAARGDRSPGLAHFQFARVHAHGLYDIEVDTSLCSSMECALQIHGYLNREQTPCTFSHIRHLLCRAQER